MKTWHLLILSLAIVISAHAGSATWQLNPASSDWNTPANWNPATVPNGASDTATFGVSNTTGVSLSASVELNGIVFGSDASAYTFATSQTIGFTISGAGIANNSGVIQTFINHGTINTFPPGSITFTNSSTAGSQTTFTNEGDGAAGFSAGGLIEFHDTSTAGNATFINFPGALAGAGGGAIQFFGSSTAADSTFTNKGPTVPNAGTTIILFFDRSQAGNGIFTLEGSQVQISQGGIVSFNDNSSAGHGTFTANGGRGQSGGAAVYFFGTSSAARATLTATSGIGQGQAGHIYFLSDARGDKARVELFGNGTLDISATSQIGVSIGSIEGDGLIELGAKNLTVGTNDLNTTFAGVIEEGGGGTGGSLTKVGRRILMLANANTYTGATSINEGTLLIKNSSGSATGTGEVHVNAGVFGGTGTVAGLVAVGTGSGSGAVFSPGRSASPVGNVTIQGSLTLNFDATYACSLDTNSATADKVSASGVTIATGAQFSLVGIGSTALSPGTIFTVINNTAATAIAGTFSNLPDNSTLTAGNNTFQANYEGGTGDDLTLTVVP